jgi:hypothetical protein
MNIINKMISIIVVVSTAFSAELVIEKKVDEFIKEVEKETFFPSDVLENAGLKGPERTEMRPVVYEVIRPLKDATEITRLRKFVGPGAEKADRVGFDSRNGCYYYSVPRLQGPQGSDKPLKRLRGKATRDLFALVGADASRFVFANTETDWEKTSDNPVPRIVGQRFRFTRKVNGGHILDNTAYVRISYDGKGDLAGFEIVNPRLKPLPVPYRVKQSATRRRLTEYAATKNSARSSIDGDISVKRISVKKGIRSYLAKKNGDKTILAPYISFFCRYDMENGESFESFSHFSLDATRCKNLDESLIEHSAR